MSRVIDRFLRYVAIDTKSDEDSGLHPSSAIQKNLGKLLFDELNSIGASDIYFDEEHNYLYASIPATAKTDFTLGFIAHMDTSPEVSGRDVKARVVENYEGGDIVLNEQLGIVLKTSVFPEILNYIGKSIIVTDGTTLLGADDKAGIAEIMEMAEILLEDIKSGSPKFMHGKITVAFTPDEEIGEGTEFFDLERFGADYAYTVDGGAIGELEYENFNAASAVIKISGVNIHPGDAKDKMVNASLIATEFNCMLPKDEIPARTSGYEGFYHLTNISGDVSSAELHYIIRDHDKAKFNSRKECISEIAEKLNSRYGENTVEVVIKDQYFNMREIIENGNMFLIDRAVAAMKSMDINPVIKPVRGGTDGAMLSFKGLPCPNLCAGGHNFHGRFEYCPVESIENISELLVRISCEAQ